jgi:hypothetical protein
MKDRALGWWLTAIGVVAVAGFAAVIATRTPRDRSELWSEVGKGLIGLVIVGVLGTVLKLLAEAYQERRRLAERLDEERRRLAERLDEFRIEKYRRVVEATNTLRKAGTLIDANRSVRTWSDQMLALIDASNLLRLIKHEIQLSSDGVSDPPFRNYADIVWLLETMYRYTESLTEDFADNKKRLSELQRHADSNTIGDEERAQRQSDVWREIRDLPSVADLLADLDEDKIGARVKSLELALRTGDRRTLEDESAAPSRVTYEAAERLALQRIAEAALGTSRAGERTSAVAPPS